MAEPAPPTTPAPRHGRPGHAGRIAAALLLTATAALAPSPSAAPFQGHAVPPPHRARDLGLRPGVLPPGPLNAITDVEGVRVGHATLVQGERIRTGVTAILPHDGNLFRQKVPAAIFVANGFGKLTGISQVRELGTLETPVLLTGTLSVPRVADALIGYMLELPGNRDVRSVNPVVGETNDGYLSDIRARPVGPDLVLEAIRDADVGPVPEGAVGAGTGTVAFGFKGGIGTASRRLPAELGGWTVGALVQTNFGGVLTIDGAPVGERLGRYPYAWVLAGEESGAGIPADGDGSCMIVLATDAPLDARNLERLASRGILGMARTGASGSNGSGDYAIAFSAHPGMRSGPDSVPSSRARPLVDDSVSPLFLAAIEATEEAIYNSLFAAETTAGFHGTVEALPREATLEILREHGVIETSPTPGEERR